VFEKTSHSVKIVSVVIALGYIEGQVIIVEYKDKKAKILNSLNKLAKNHESLFSSIGSFFSSK
jgi:hypothetical protein